MTTFSKFDHQMMSRAISLAKGGIYTTAPNPNVGCVLVKNGAIIGEGFHYRAGEPHAEVHALRMAGEKAEGATAYVTLEPCSHYGRTPPCAEGLIKAKVAKVICAMQDPNPQVAGRGIQMLRDAGIDVAVGLLEPDAEALNPAFIKRMKTGMPYVQLKMAASLDGQTALSNGQSKWITSSHARQDVQAFRAQAGSILSTSKTVIEDNASLNVRWDDLPPSIQQQIPQAQLRQPTRIILDRTNQLSTYPELKFHQAEGTQLVLSEYGEIPCTIDEDGSIDLEKAMFTLAQQHNINHIWVEAGATLASSLLKANLVDEIVLYQAPKLMGSDGRGLFGAFGLQAMNEVLDLTLLDVRQIGQDIRIIAKPTKKEN
ncbi:bifunctional diaminohydroxyphosphoribosylaminopyrimidine deaminase/5-amino-6-(5-phosphoribosylamino)uracil reductase RibD [Vibrio sp. TRT 21S02]|uniref:bifunctional diaminohydroxyphosphoribosylaminopyrimidine deaminase/5-amino-6-(5-phosphoribosylamino)uracil reductase RibD n=1 Tax=Vibrio sp. TRT 21S02 TaxID=3418507 RepID=UPI003CF51448